ncbi:calpain-11-like [Pelmatolapia mariae]|uniref:calpain-11-like n=1 Tax=Pelmatolapia mariae TaxID=158779 RepID=UPI002FE5D7E8
MLSSTSATSSSTKNFVFSQHCLTQKNLSEDFFIIIMAQSETCLINLRYQDGSEGSPSNPAKFKNQDFAQIKDYCLRKGGLFVDNAFPLNGRSLGDLPNMSPSQESEVKWLRPADLLREQRNKDKPVFCTDGTSRFDFGQGEVGNCWFLSAISALTFQENLMAQVVPTDQCFEGYAGIFHFRFCRFGKWVDVVIDDNLPTINKRLLSVSSKCGNEFWAPLLEKAYAKLCGSYADMHAGFPSEACKDFTGGVNQTYKLKEMNSAGHGDLWLTLNRATQCQSLICCWTYHKEGALVSDTGLVNGHAYSVTDVTEVELNGSKVRLVRVMNPWGKREWNGKWSDKSDLWNKVRPEVRKKCFDRDDGEFWMQMEDFCSYFAYVSICCETPNFTDGDFKCQWKCMIYDGSWAAGKSAGGAVNHSTFATNPQYRIQVSVIDKKEPGDKNIVLSLMQKPHQGNRKEIRLHPAGLTIYKTPQGRLQHDFFQRNRPVKAQQAYSYERDHTELHSLEPGEYVIIPSTFNPNMTADFILTVYTKTDIKISPYNGGDDDEDDDRLSEIHDKDKEKATDEDPNHSLFKLYADQLDQRMTMTFAEFSILWKKVQEYKNLFHRCDVNRNGSLSNPELQKAIEAAGMDVNDASVGLMMFRYSGFSSTSLEEFITLMLRLDKMSDIFKGKSSDGVIHLNWDEWSVISMYN